MRGRGMDYWESRAYQPGDDIRQMDWRVTARSGRPHTKLYREERERPVIVVTDFGYSMWFATRTAFKSVIAARVAALLGWSAVANGDRIGGFIFGNCRHHELSPSAGRRGVLRLIQALSHWREPKSTDPFIHLSDVLTAVRRVARPGSLIIILSDFYRLDGAAREILLRLRSHNDIIACRILDQLEWKAPPPGQYAITDGLSTAILNTADPVFVRDYQQSLETGHRTVKRLLSGCGVPMIELQTSDDPVTQLCASGLFARR